MKSKWILIFVLGLSIGLLTACGDLEDILTQLLAEDNDNNVENNVEENVNNNGVENNENNSLEDNSNNNSNDDATIDGPVEELGSKVFFDEKLIEDGYTITTLPNGFPLTVPYHFVLVDHNMNESDATEFNGRFCYNLPLEPNEVGGILESLNEVNFEQVEGDGDVLHRINYSSDEEFTGGNGTFNFIIDEHGNSCAELTYEFLNEEMQEGLSGEFANIPSFTDTNSYVVEDRERTVPSDYEDGFYEYIERTYDINDMGYDSEDVESIEEDISNGNFEMEHLTSGHPKIFPYEWYLMKYEMEDSGWNASYCTDVSISESILKFHSLLEAHNADILHYETNGSPSMNSKSKVEFEFNDEHSTGSWKGDANFHIDRLGEFKTHKCILVNMDFSPDILE